ncbi:meiotically up-regulated gene 113-domain-containing protein [Aspergillus carlsbadensis]|nr:meiotically up-regulated gene 113-domain-containing protein [Aspergillus carlsbadensis]
MSEAHIPQTPTRSPSPAKLPDSSLRTPSTPPASPGDEAASVFSPNESIATDVTDYGWESPSRKVDGDGDDDDHKPLSLSLPPPQILVEDTADPTSTIDDSVADVCGTEPRTFLEDTHDAPVSESTPRICVTGATEELDNVSSPPGVSANAASADDSNASESALDTDKPLSGSPPNDDHVASVSAVTTDQEKWSPPQNRPVFTYQPAPEDVLSRRCSFNSKPNSNFLSDGQLFRTKPRAKSTGASGLDTVASIQTFRALITQPAVPPSATEEVAKEEPTEKDTRPAKAMGDEDLKLLELLKRLIPPSLEDVPVENKPKCVATIHNNTRCASKAQTPNFALALRNLNDASSLKEASLPQTIKTLFSLLLCGRHKNVAARLSARWQPNPSSALPSGAVLALQEWLKSVRGTSTPSPTSKPEGTPSVEVVIPPRDTRVKTALPDFVDYHPSGKERPCVSDELEKFIVAPISNADANHSGHIYIYQCRGKFGYYKIGLTTDVAPRLRSWEKQCGRDLMSYFPQSEADLQLVPHISRAERLIHVELAPYRRKEARCPPGSGCGKSHTEWFCVDEQLAVRVVRKWIAWMRTEPYVQIQGGSTWVLDVNRVGSIEEIRTPLSKEIPVQLPLQTGPSLAVPTAPKGRKRSKSMC